MKTLLFFVLCLFCVESFAQKKVEPGINPAPTTGSRGGSVEPGVKPAPRQNPRKQQPVEEAPPEVVTPQSNFAEVQGWFQAGQKIKWVDFKGTYVGYCYRFPALSNGYLNGEITILTYVRAEGASRPEFIWAYSAAGGTIDTSYTIPPLYKHARDIAEINILPYFLQIIYQKWNTYDFRWQDGGFSDSPTVMQKRIMKSNWGNRRHDSVEEYRRFGDMIVSERRSISTVYDTGFEIVDVVQGQVLQTCYYPRKIGN